MQNVHNIAILMVTEGLLTRDALERAVARKQRQGGSLALSLVLEGAVDEVRLAHYFARTLGLEPASEAMLAGVDPDTFHLLPLEIVYDSAILPLYLVDDETLVVGLVDPTDDGLVTEASFFSGYNLLPRLITVSQMARHFSRLAKQPWKITTEKAQSLSKQSAPTLELRADDIDALLDQTTTIDERMDSALLESLDETYHPEDPDPMWADTHEEAAVEVGGAAGNKAKASLWLGGSAVEGVNEITFQGIAGQPTRPLVVDEAALERAVVESSQVPTLQPGVTPSQIPTIRVEIDPEQAAAVGLTGGPETLPTDGAAVVEGEAITDTGSMRVFGFSLESADHDAADTTPSPVVSTRDSFTTRPKTHVPTRPGPVPSDVDTSKHLHLLTRMPDVLGEAEPRIASAITEIVSRLEVVRERDSLGEAVVTGLGDWFEHVVVFTLNGPRAVFWRGQLGKRPAQDAIGQTIDIHEGGVMHHVTNERVFYYGPLSESSALRAGLGIEHRDPVLVAPIELRGKTILILVLDPGDRPMTSPGRHLEELLVGLSRGLARVILMRRKGRRRRD